jgi:Domain of Unknown Function (DUF1206)
VTSHVPRAADARRAARRPWVGYLGRAGLAAQGVCFGIIGVLAIAVATNSGGETTDPEGALSALARHGWTKALLVLLTIGFIAYAVWRYAQALLDRGGMGSDAGGLARRAIQLGQGTIYAFLAWGAIKVARGSDPKPGAPRRAAAGVLGWPAGRELVAAAAAFLVVVGVVTAYWAVSGRFKESLATREMSSQTERIVTATGVVGLCSLAGVLGIVAWFLFKTAIQFKPSAAVGIGGALAHLARASYGSWLLGIVASGLIVFAVFDLLQARYHEA